MHELKLRRTALTNMADIGLSESQSMAVAGQLSVDVDRRYKSSEGKTRNIAARIDK